MAGANDPADALIAEGNKAEDSGRLQEACALYRKAVAASPGYARAHLNLGIGLEASGDALLAELRRSLRQKMRLSPIMDEAAFVRDLESVYRTMWRAWCEGRI